ncbi:MAG: hypothetical protein ACRD5K_17290 [Candidatus Acidiferrales bacterium]
MKQNGLLALAALLFLPAATFSQTATSQATMTAQGCSSVDHGKHYECSPAEVVQGTPPIPAPKVGCTPDPVTKGCVMLLGQPDESPTTSMRPRRWYRSRRFWTLFALDAIATTIDYKTSQDGIGRGGREGNPIFGSDRASMARMEAVGLPVAFGAEYLGYRLSAHHKVLGIVPTTANVGSHVFFSVHNELLCRPSCGSGR